MRTVLCSMLVVSAACTGEQVDQQMPPVLERNRPDIIATNAFYYYHDVDAAWLFYRDTLGFETVVDYGFAKILRLAESHVGGSEGCVLNRPGAEVHVNRSWV